MSQENKMELGSEKVSMIRVVEESVWNSVRGGE